MTGYQTTGSPQEARFSDQRAWDRAYDAAYDYAEALGLEFEHEYRFRDFVLEVATDHNHPAWDHTGVST